MRVKVSHHAMTRMEERLNNMELRELHKVIDLLQVGERLEELGIFYEQVDGEDMYMVKIKPDIRLIFKYLDERKQSIALVTVMKHD